jgi:hypothetical protein
VRSRDETRAFAASLIDHKWAEIEERIAVRLAALERQVATLQQKARSVPLLQDDAA